MPVVKFGRQICNDLSVATSLEWLVTNGIGGFACGTLAGILTRRYHGLLIAALEPPTARTLMVTKLDESVYYDGKDSVHGVLKNAETGGLIGTATLNVTDAAAGDLMPDTELAVTFGMEAVDTGTDAFSIDFLTVISER